MATSSGLQTVDLTARMLREARTFSLVQALRLLGYLHAHDPHDSKARRAFFEKNITIRSWLSLAFPPCEITEIKEDERGFYTIVTTGIGLYSTLGALPTLYTEELLEEERRDESVSRDFLDILDNHLAHLRYKASLHHRLERRTVEYKSREALYMQSCLMGQADPSLWDKGLPSVFLAEILAKRARSAAQLERFLCLVLGRHDVRIEQCVETRRAIPKDQICRLGADCASLGRDAMLGMCLRDSTSRFRIHLDCVAQKDMRFFLPNQPGYAILEHHLRLFLDSPLEFELTLHPEQAPPQTCALGKNSQIGFFLGSPTACAPVRVFWNASA